MRSIPYNWRHSHKIDLIPLPSPVQLFWNRGLCLTTCRCVVAFCTNATQESLEPGIDYGSATRTNGTEYKFLPHERVNMGDKLTYHCKKGKTLLLHENLQD